MQLTDPANLATLAQQPCGAAWVQARQRNRFERKRVARTRRDEQRLDIALYVVEVRRRAHLPRHTPLLRQPRTTCNAGQRVNLPRACVVEHEPRAALEEPDAILLPSLILQSRTQEPRPQRDAHDGQVARDRVGE